MKHFITFIIIATFLACNNNPESTTTKPVDIKPTEKWPKTVKDSLPDAVVKYLDTLPLEKLDLANAVLPNGKHYKLYLNELKTRNGFAENKSFIFKTDKPLDQLSELIASFYTNAADLIDDSKHTVPKGTDNTEPAQTGLAYNLGSRDHMVRTAMSTSMACDLKVFGLDCSGFIFQVFQKSGCIGMNITAAEQSNPANLNAAIAGVVDGIEAKSKGKLTSGQIQNGDLIYWDKIGGSGGSHIGIALKKADGTVAVFESNGSGSECDGNLLPGRGPRTFGLNDNYWFAANCNWNVLRYEVK